MYKGQPRTRMCFAFDPHPTARAPAPGSPWTRMHRPTPKPSLAAKLPRGPWGSAVAPASAAARAAAAPFRVALAGPGPGPGGAAGPRRSPAPPPPTRPRRRRRTAPGREVTLFHRHLSSRLQPAHLTPRGPQAHDVKPLLRGLPTTRYHAAHARRVKQRHRCHQWAGKVKHGWRRGSLHACRTGRTSPSDFLAGFFYALIPAPSRPR